MSLTKLVDGVRVNLTPAEITAQQAEWTANQAGTEQQVRAEHDRRLEAGKTFTLTGYGQGVLVQGTQQVLMDLLFRKSQADAGLSPIAWVSGGIAHSLTTAQFLELYTLALTHGDALRTAMHTIIAMDPIPADYAADSRWPA